MTIFAFDYAVLLAVLLVAAYNVLKAPDDDKRNGGRKTMKMAEKDGFLKETMSRMRSERHALEIKE